MLVGERMRRTGETDGFSGSVRPAIPVHEEFFVVEDYTKDPVSQAYANFFDSYRHALVALAGPCIQVEISSEFYSRAGGNFIQLTNGSRSPVDGDSGVKTNRGPKYMAKEIITSASSPTTGFTDKATPSPLAQGIRFGNMMFVSGQGPLNPETKEVVSEDIRADLSDAD